MLVLVCNIPSAYLAMWDHSKAKQGQIQLIVVGQPLLNLDLQIKATCMHAPFAKIEVGKELRLGAWKQIGREGRGAIFTTQRRRRRRVHNEQKNWRQKRKLHTSCSFKSLSVVKITAGAPFSVHTSSQYLLIDAIATINYGRAEEENIKCLGMRGGGEGRGNDTFITPTIPSVSARAGGSLVQELW